MKIRKFKTAVAMIELIFAIVIIGIVLLSNPMLIQQSVNVEFCGHLSTREVQFPGKLFFPNNGRITFGSPNFGD